MAPLVVPPARAVHTPKPSLPWVHLCMHDKVINIRNAHKMQYVMMLSQGTLSRVSVRGTLSDAHYEIARTKVGTLNSAL